MRSGVCWRPTNWACSPGPRASRFAWKRSSPVRPRYMAAPPTIRWPRCRSRIARAWRSTSRPSAIVPPGGQLRAAPRWSSRETACRSRPAIGCALFGHLAAPPGAVQSRRVRLCRVRAGRWPALHAPVGVPRGGGAHRRRLALATCSLDRPAACRRRGAARPQSCAGPSPSGQRHVLGRSRGSRAPAERSVS